MRRRSRIRSGALIGCDADEERWKASCRIPLFPEQWNTWFLVRSMVDGISLSEIPDRAREVLRFWFRETSLLPGFTMGDATNIEISIVEDHGGATGPNVDPRLVAADIRDCSPSASLREENGSSPFVMVRVRFVFRGTQPSLSWPAARSTLRLPGVAVLPEWCPVDADWLCLQALKPEEAPIPPTLGEKIKGVGKALGKAAERTTKQFAWGMAAPFVALGLGLFVWSKL